ncbi:MAG: DUF4140 domain-containing protein [Polyangiaceae bacterium]|nr:DUF4140 domain-containing protein [Polyangiaceae bacterium]
MRSVDAYHGGVMSSRIGRVTVFRRGARVERVLEVADETSEVRFCGLPRAR